MSIPEELIDALNSSRRTVALTGAGMSVESGIAPFRGTGGLWEKFSPEEYAHIDGFNCDPEKSWKLFRLQYQEISKAAPNPGHKALEEMQEYGLSAVITQNIDGLHRNREVVELHGNIFRTYCVKCGTNYDTGEFIDEDIDIHCSCSGVVRPDVVLFGEPLSSSVLSHAVHLSSRCDLMLVIGTSAVVHPAASLPLIAKENGALIVEMNLDKTPLSHGIADITVFGNVGEQLPIILDRLRRI